MSYYHYEKQFCRKSNKKTVFQRWNNFPSNPPAPLGFNNVMIETNERHKMTRLLNKKEQGAIFVVSISQT